MLQIFLDNLLFQSSEYRLSLWQPGRRWGGKISLWWCQGLSVLLSGSLSVLTVLSDHLCFEHCSFSPLYRLLFGLEWFPSLRGADTSPLQAKAVVGTSALCKPFY